MRIRRFAIIVVAVTLATGAAAQHEHHDHDAMNARGEKAMGFSQTATTHHFKLLPDGGFVQVQANDATDTANRDHIRMHLQEQARRFAAGDFSLSEMTHDRVLPGTPQMKTLKSAIAYKYEEIERGGRLRISSKDQAAISAIHDFLKFQIEDHKTGDLSTVSANKLATMRSRLRLIVLVSHPWRVVEWTDRKSARALRTSSAGRRGYGSREAGSARLRSTAACGRRPSPATNNG